MTSVLIDGKQIAKSLREEVALRVKRFEEIHGRKPGLEVVLVGQDPASLVYTRNKEAAAREVGVRAVLHTLAESTGEQELLRFVAELNQREDVDAILIQLPLPKHIRETLVLDAIAPDKDVDGFHPYNAGLLMSGRPELVPCTPRAVMRLIASTGVSPRGKRAVVMGRSNIVGKPLAALLLAADATVTIAHSKTQDLAAICREADILVAAVGKAHLVSAEYVKPGSVVIDVGINRSAEGKLVGDADTEAVRAVAGFITPVPGGVGPMTIACLLENTLSAAERRASARA